MEGADYPEEFVSMRVTAHRQPLDTVLAVLHLQTCRQYVSAWSFRPNRSPHFARVSLGYNQIDTHE